MTPSHNTTKPDYGSWQAQRPKLQQHLFNLLGNLPPRSIPQPTLHQRTPRNGWTYQHLTFDNGAGATVSASLLIPDGEPPFPAVLYHHLHGNKYWLGKSEILLDRGTHPAPGIALAQKGYVVLCIDAYGFGDRQTDGDELSLAKHFLWRGQSLWGMMLRDDLLALDWLAAHPLIDAEQIHAVGMSMGGSRATWLAALDDRIASVVPIAQLTRYAEFAASGAYHHHGIYYYLPSMLTSGIDMEHLVALVAPRPQLILIGDRDPLSPLEGIQKTIDFARQVYALYAMEDALRVVIYPGVAHAYTNAMLEDMLAWF